MRIIPVALALLLVSAGEPLAAESAVGGIDHVGLTVTKLTASEQFFTETPGFSLLRRDEDYPAVFLGNGAIIVTLWRATEPDEAVPFDRKHNVGLHHLAFAVESFEALDALHGRLAAAPGVTIEFSPEPCPVARPGT